LKNTKTFIRMKDDFIISLTLTYSELFLQD
jgi:hypothetical protein